MKNLTSVNCQGLRIAYESQAGKGVGIFYLGGFRSNMAGTKVKYLRDFCTSQEISFTSFDYAGHGLSEGNFADGTIGLWLDNAIAVLSLCPEPQILVGSSMGGWLMLLLALKFPEKVKALVGIAAAPDFSEELFYASLSLAQRHELHNKGIIYLVDDSGSSYPITWQMIEEARGHLILNHSINIHCPVHLLHGMQDIEVPYQRALTLNKNLLSPDIYLHLFKSGDHRLNTPEALEFLAELIYKLSKN